MFFAVTETWLRDELDAEITIPNYQVFRADRKLSKKKFGRNSGGALIYVREEVSNTYEETLNYSNGAVEVIAIHSAVEQLHIVCIYRQPDSTANRSTSKEFKQAMTKLNAALANFKQQNIIITGDFNLPHITPNLNEFKEGISNDEKNMIHILDQLMNEHLLMQYINKPTHIKGNMLDLLLTNNDEIIHEIKYHQPPQSTSDHFIIEVDTKLTSGVWQENDTEGNVPLAPLRTLNFQSEQISWAALIEEFDNINWDEELENLEPEDMVQKITELCFEKSSVHVPVSTRASSNKKKQHIPRDRKRLMKRRRRLNKQHLNSASPTNKQRIWKELIQIEKKLHLSRKNSKNYMEKKAIKSIKKNVKYFFTYAKKFSKTNSKIGPLKNKLKKYVYKNTEIAELLSQQYLSVFSKPEQRCPTKEELFSDDEHMDFNDIQFDQGDFISAINELSTTAGAGPDGLPAILLKKCKHSLSRALYILWNRCYELEVTPLILKLAHILPMFKTGIKTLPENYRPVALTSHIIKVFEKVVRSRITAHLETTEQFNENQHGFRKGRSCLSQLLLHFDQIAELLEQGHDVDTVYLDFSKAFDRVDFEILLSKLGTVGIGGKIGRWIHSFLTERTQAVLVNKTISEQQQVMSGVPQGSVLGPLLFVIMIGDIGNSVQSSTVRCFADDTKVTKGVKGEKDVTDLQADLEIIYQWTEQNKMKLNSSKFEHLRYKTKSTSAAATTQYTTNDGCPITEKMEVKDLGVTMTNDATFNKHITNVTHTLRKLGAWILRTFESREMAVLHTTWKMLSLPRHDYCSILWSPHQAGLINELELVQWSFLRKCNSFYVQDYWDALKKHKLYSLQRRRERFMIIYVYKILEGIAPPTGIEENREGRRRRTLKITTSARTTSTRYHSFNHVAPRLWNCLPASIRELTNKTVDCFKTALDNFLETVPDEPQIPSLRYKCCSTSNNILQMRLLVPPTSASQ